jgi:polyphosphate kinase
VRQEPEVRLPDRLISTSNYQRPPRELSTYVPDHAATLLDEKAEARS